MSLVDKSYYAIYVLLNLVACLCNMTCSSTSISLRLSLWDRRGVNSCQSASKHDARSLPTFCSPTALQTYTLCTAAVSVTEMYSNALGCRCLCWSLKRLRQQSCVSGWQSCSRRRRCLSLPGDTVGSSCKAGAKLGFVSVLQSCLSCNTSSNGECPCCNLVTAATVVGCHRAGCQHGGGFVAEGACCGVKFVEEANCRAGG